MTITGKFAQYKRCGGGSTELELVYNDLVSNLGSYYQSSDSILIETLSYAKAIVELKERLKEHINNETNIVASKFTYKLDEESNLYSLSFIKTEYEKRLLLSLLQASKTLTINEHSLTTILKTIAPKTFVNVMVNRLEEEIFEPNYSINTLNPINTNYNKPQQPLDNYLSLNGFHLTGGVSWDYQVNSHYSSSLNTFRIRVKNENDPDFNYEMNKISAYLNIVCAPFINWTFDIVNVNLHKRTPRSVFTMSGVSTLESNSITIYYWYRNSLGTMHLLHNTIDITYNISAADIMYMLGWVSPNAYPMETRYSYGFVNNVSFAKSYIDYPHSWFQVVFETVDPGIEIEISTDKGEWKANWNSITTHGEDADTITGYVTVEFMQDGIVQTPRVIYVDGEYGLTYVDRVQCAGSIYDYLRNIGDFNFIDIYMWDPLPIEFDKVGFQLLNVSQSDTASAIKVNFTNKQYEQLILDGYHSFESNYDN